jgi:hypothetical protein
LLQLIIHYLSVKVVMLLAKRYLFGKAVTEHLFE